MLALQVFQSAPGTNAGRSQASRRERNAVKLFQSAPGTNAGRSIVIWGLTNQGTGFNPRPARMPGDPTACENLQHAGYVSIRARHECRAILHRLFQP